MKKVIPKKKNAFLTFIKKKHGPYIGKDAIVGIAMEDSVKVGNVEYVNIKMADNLTKFFGKTVHKGEMVMFDKDGIVVPYNV